MTQKELGKMIDVFVSHAPGDFGQRIVGIGQRKFGFRHPPLNHIVDGRNTVFFSKFVTDITDTGVKLF